MKIKAVIAFSLLFLIVVTAFAAQTPRIGLVLSGGCAKGIAHIGVLKVLEEYGIQPDYITGTSMGSIIGGLYSLGYSAEELETLILSQNWDELLFDTIPRRSISLEEKEDYGRYILSFPINGIEVSLPQGLVAGQNISQLITRLTISAHQITDFRKMPIPFLCIGTDIETGEAVVLDSGFLPEAIRASMSLPSMFTPVEYNGKLLVDGGLVRSFPVSDCLDMGADFIIGVDVGTGLRNRSELNSLVSIMQQAVAFQGSYSSSEEQKLTDILIQPQVEDYSITDFRKGKELIAIGEAAARKVADQLAELQKKLPEQPVKTKSLKAIPNKILIKDINFEGLHKVSKNLIIGKSKIKKNSWTDIMDIDQTITQLYGSGYFERVIYKLQPSRDGSILTIIVKEKTTNSFRFAIHYDSDMKAAMLLNTTFRNMVVPGSKVSIDARLGENMSFRWKEFIHTGWKPGFGLGWDVYYDQFGFDYRDSEGNKLARLNIENYGSVIDFKTIFSNNFALCAAIDGRIVNTTGDIVPPEWEGTDKKNKWLRLSDYLLVDSRDKEVYPTEGIYLFMEVKKILSNADSSVFNQNFIRYYMDTETLIPVRKNLCLAFGAFGGFTDAQEAPYEEAFFLGGFTDKDNIRPFAGLNFAEVAAEEVYIGRIRLQYEPFDSKYLILRYDFARIIRDFKGFEAQKFNLQGWAATIGINSPIGPIELSIMGSDQNPNDLKSYISIGYCF
ncbi:MAG: patatin-like phospholipase family protein [Candidatus Cloacimonetes bacterium]|nr:patatin-like phospholipase family protein [Candidatus Cloacimonadota bacterium]